MAQLPTFRRFTISDFPTAPEWLSTLFNPLNIYCEQSINALNQNLTIGPNVQGLKHSATFTTSATYATGTFSPITFTYNGTGQPNCLMIGNIKRSDGVLILDPISITDWSLNINVSPFLFSVNYIAGLAPSTKYSVTFVAL